MENNNPAKTSAKDFFLHLGAIVSLYVVVIAFLNLLFTVINKAYPQIATYYNYYGSSNQISLPVATLIIVFPLFIILSWINHRTYEKSPETRTIAVRKWLTYITLFIAGIILAGDLVTVLYNFLDGQEITTAFILKALSVLVVSGLIFGFYLQDIRDRVSKKGEKIWAIVTSVIILISIIIGFNVIGSPYNQRLQKYDDQKILDLQNIQWEVITYWQTNGFIPEKLENMSYLPQDTQTNESYEYKKTGELSFELCASFNRGNMMNPNQPELMRGAYPIKGTMPNDNWQHNAGRQCFQRSIDPSIYPTQIKG